jgi:hypothetical protein
MRACARLARAVELSSSSGPRGSSWARGAPVTDLEEEQPEVAAGGGVVRVVGEDLLVGLPCQIEVPVEVPLDGAAQPAVHRPPRAVPITGLEPVGQCVGSLVHDAPPSRSDDAPDEAEQQLRGVDVGQDELHVVEGGLEPAPRRRSGRGRATRAAGRTRTRRRRAPSAPRAT